MQNERMAHFKKQLESERGSVEKKLQDFGVEDASGNWNATPGAVDTSATEPDEIADRVEAYEENREEVAQMQQHLRNIMRALANIEDGTYGICEIGGEEIEEERLSINPSARTCVSHKDEEATLGA
jgi:RNA polymerase-binding transcription factor DksA